MNTSKKRVTFSSENSIPLSENNTGIFENSTSDSNKDQSFSSESFSPSVILNGIDSPSDASFSRLVRTQSLNINDIPQLFNGGDKDSNIEKHTFNPYTENETEIINQELNRSIFQEKKQKNRFSIQNSMKKVLGSPIATIKEEFQNIDLSFSPKIRDFRNSRNGWYQLANYSNSSNSNPFNSKQNSNKREMRVSNQKENRIFDSNINSMNNSSFSSNKKERRHRSLRSLLISFLIIVITLLSQMICFQSSFFGVLFGKWTESAEKFHSILNPPQSGYKFKIFSIKKWKRFLNRLNPWQYLILFVHIIQICVLFLFGISFLIAHYSYRSKLSNNAVNQLGYEWFYGTFSQNVYFIANILLIKTFEILFLWSSMFWENSIQILVGYFMSSLSLIIQMILFYLVQRQSNDSFKEWISFSMMITVLICLVINVPVVLRMCFRFGGRMFRIVGVSKLNILLFMNDQYIISILVGDIQFVLTTLLLVIFCFNFPWWVYLILMAYSYLSVAFIPFFISVLYRLENRLFSTLFCLYQSILPGFLIYILVGLFTKHTLTLRPLYESGNSTQAVWEISHVTIIVGLSILWRLFSIAWCLFSIVFLYGNLRRKLNYRHLFCTIQEEMS